MLQGANDRGSAGYFGPRPPEGDPPHHYHIQVFALDKPLDLPPGADRDQLLSAMQGTCWPRASWLAPTSNHSPARKPQNMGFRGGAADGPAT